MKTFKGPVLFLDRGDINTDEILPARYMNELTKAALKPHCLEDLRLEGFDARRDVPGKAVLVTRQNFGCGSSREHAPWTLEENGIHVVLAQSCARIFRQNMFNCGMLALELPKATIDELFERFGGTPATLALDLASSSFEVQAGAERKKYAFEVAPFDRALVQAGGWVEYADARY
jgi:3-isopropylmalate/(R)-2-methylmalate dehydratase small subunit